MYCSVMVILECIPGWHKVVEVDNSDEGLELRSGSNLLLAHFLGDWAWVSVNSSDQSMAVRLVSRSIIVVLQKQKPELRLLTNQIGK